MTPAGCCVDGCESAQVFSRGMCQKHYVRVLKYGDPAMTKRPGRGATRCSIEGCDASGPFSLSLCRKHYARHLRNGDPTVVKRVASVDGLICTVDGCESPWFESGYCKMHMRRWRRHGDVEHCEARRGNVADRALANAVVDPATGCLIWQGRPTKPGYSYLSHQGRRVLGHRAVWEKFNGPIPAGMEIDHLCFVRNCINIEHLECVTPAENKRRMVIHRDAKKRAAKAAA